MSHCIVFRSKAEMGRQKDGIDCSCISIGILHSLSSLVRQLQINIAHFKRAIIRKEMFTVEWWRKCKCEFTISDVVVVVVVVVSLVEADSVLTHVLTMN